MKFGNEFWLILFREYISPKLFAVKDGNRDKQRFTTTPFSLVLHKEYFDCPQRDSHAVHYIKRGGRGESAREDEDEETALKKMQPRQRTRRKQEDDKKKGPHQPHQRMRRKFTIGQEDRRNTPWKMRRRDFARG
jgi:hypothetical protein